MKNACPFFSDVGILQRSRRASQTIPVRTYNGQDRRSLIAGIHGNEYPPIVALQSLHLQIDPEQVSGTIIMVHIANDGFVIYMLGTPPVNKGEILFSIAITD